MPALFSRCLAFIVSLAQALLAVGGMPMEQHIRTERQPVNLFVSGLLGYGEKSGVYYLRPPFGALMKNVLHVLEDHGYECYAASMGPFSSNWDRACELWAELTGATVDYGAAHSEKHGHARYGRNFRTPLIPNWGPDRPLNLWGYSFGGHTALLFAQLLAEGSAEERAATPKNTRSPLFDGGRGNFVHSVTTLASPLNGTSAEIAMPEGGAVGTYIPIYSVVTIIGSLSPLNGLYDIHLEQYGLSGISGEGLLHLARPGNLIKYLIGPDNVLVELSPGGALEVNKQISTRKDVYYFSYAGEVTRPNGKGNFLPPLAELQNPLLYYYSYRMGTGVGEFAGERFQPPEGAFTIDDSWKPNDGAVNVVSAKYPFGAPHKSFDPKHIVPGVWQVMPVLKDHNHGFFSGIDMKYSFEDMCDFYLGHLKVLEETYSS
jgi:triacylglycerol lipase